MKKILTVQLAVEEFEFYDLYNDIIESYGEELEDPSLVSDLYDLIDEYEEEFEFWPDSSGDFSESFERNLREAITTIVDENNDMAFIDDTYPDGEDIGDIYDEAFEENSKEFGVDFGEPVDHDDY